MQPAHEVSLLSAFQSPAHLPIHPPTPPEPQSLKLLPPSLEPPTVARFLRCCPGLAKPSIGEILGERDTFYDQVRAAFRLVIHK